ncbi:transglycosylase SLT domain-containing protein [Streptomyces sp. NPDC090306]|uniref:transglycosylase SLT domain-containing protein n=1 Tax=unclassified Streptomyces TaxID=2593676 RepID=UPI0036E27894
MHKYVRFRRPASLNRNQKIALAGVATIGAASLAFAVAPSDGHTTTTDASSQSAVTYKAGRIQGVSGSITGQSAGDSVKTQTIAAQKKADSDAAAKKKADAAKKKAAVAAAAKKAAQARSAKEAASRSAKRAEVKTVSAKSYANNLNGWITQALDIMHEKHIPGSYHGLYKNIMRESSGNPQAINDWDVNAVNGIPSKGLLQVIPPTFAAYHVSGTSSNIYDPVANITAAANYAADKYGSIDNVNSAY